MSQTFLPPRPRVIVFGGYGVFGSIVARELVQRGVPVTIAGRDGRKGESLARELGSECSAVEANLADRASCSQALNGHVIAVHCAGPFAEMDDSLLDACLEHGCHYVDIADDRAYVARVQQYDERFSRAGLTAAYGCSSLPSISLALAQHARAESAVPVEGVRVGLFIGHDNPKGDAAVRSATRMLGRPIAAQQVALVGFRDWTIVPLPPPIGRRPMLNFETPDYDLLPRLLGAREVIVNVGFESRLVTAAFGCFARCAPAIGRRVLPWLAAISGPLRHFGTSCGVVFAELVFADGSRRSAAMVARRDGQRLAALPCVYVVERLARGEACAAGAHSGGEILGHAALLERLVQDGFSLHDES